jgi:hypothetical protein
VTAEIARAIGYSDGQVRIELRRSRWHQLVRGVYLTRVDRPVRSDWIAAGFAIAGNGAALSGWDAVRTYSIGSDRAPVNEVLILSAHGTHRTAGRVRVRPSHRPVSACRRGLADGGFGSAPVVSAARAVADTALVYRRFDPVRALVTSAVQRRLCTPDELAAELAAGPQNGSAHLRRALEDVFSGVQSISEAELRDVIIRGGLPLPEFNIEIHTWDGQHVATADALWRGLRAALEVDSKKYHFYEEKWEGTMKRHNLLTRRRLAVTHYPPRQLLNEADRVTSEIDEWLRERAIEIGEKYPPPPPEVGPDGRLLRRPFVLPRPRARPP